MHILVSCLLAGFLSAVFRTCLLTAFNAGRIQSAADDVITHTRQVFNTTPADQHYAVLLQVMTDTGNVRKDFIAVG